MFAAAAKFALKSRRPLRWRKRWPLFSGTELDDPSEIATESRLDRFRSPISSPLLRTKDQGSFVNRPGKFEDWN